VSDWNDVYDRKGEYHGTYKEETFEDPKFQRLLFSVKNVKPRVKISMGNTKLGVLPNFNLPARSFILNGQRVVTCPGASLLCRRVCYAQKGQYVVNGWVPINYAANYLASLEPDFVEAMVREIGKAEDEAVKIWKSEYGELKYKKERIPRLFRLHVSGDFYSPEYARKWLEIGERMPDTTFYVYTKAWITFKDDRDTADVGMTAAEVNELNAKIMDVLKLVNELPNFQVLLSTDDTTGPVPPELLDQGFKEAGIGFTYAKREGRPDSQCPYQRSSEKYAPEIAAELDSYRAELVSRGVSGKELKKALETKKEDLIMDEIRNGKIITCNLCGFCWDKARYSKLNVWFAEH